MQCVCNVKYLWPIPLFKHVKIRFIFDKEHQENGSVKFYYLQLVVGCCRLPKNDAIQKLPKQKFRVFASYSSSSLLSTLSSSSSFYATFLDEGTLWYAGNTYACICLYIYAEELEPRTGMFANALIVRHSESDIWDIIGFGAFNRTEDFEAGWQYLYCSKAKLTTLYCT